MREYRVRAIKLYTRARRSGERGQPATDRRWRTALASTAQSPLGNLSDQFGSRSALVGSALVGNGPDFTADDPAARYPAVCHERR